MSDDLDFGSLEPIMVGPIEISGRKFTIREASGDSDVKYQNAIEAARIYDANGIVVGWKDLTMADYILIASCLIEHAGGGLEAVPVEQIRNWPRKTLKKILKKIRQISEYDAEISDEQLLAEKSRIEKELEKRKNGSAAKNVPQSTLTGSS